MGPSKPILNWPTVQRKTGWGVLILIGGGYAIAAASDESGFSDWVANNLAKIVDGWDAWVICLLCSVMAAMFTEVTSNSAACALFVPLLNKLVSCPTAVYYEIRRFWALFDITNFTTNLKTKMVYKIDW